MKAWVYRVLLGLAILTVLASSEAMNGMNGSADWLTPEEKKMLKAFWMKIVRLKCSNDSSIQESIMVCEKHIPQEILSRRDQTLEELRMFVCENGTLQEIQDGVCSGDEEYIMKVQEFFQGVRDKFLEELKMMTPEEAKTKVMSYVKDTQAFVDCIRSIPK